MSMPHVRIIRTARQAAFVRISPGAEDASLAHNPNMAKRGQKTQKDFKHTWYAREWLEYYGKIQADLIRDLNWPRAKASDIWNGQPYRQELVDELAPYLNVKPYEMLLTPDMAMAIRSLRVMAGRIASEDASDDTAKLKITDAA